MVFKNRNVRIVNSISLLTILFYFQLGTAQNAVPNWNLFGNEQGFATLFEEFGNSGIFLYINKSSNASTKFANNYSIIDSDGKILLQKSLEFFNFEITWSRSYYDTLSQNIRLFGLGTKNEFFKYDHFVTITIDNKGNILGFNSYKMKGEIGYRSLNYLFDKGKFKISVSSDFGFLDFNNGTESIFENVFLNITDDGNIDNETYLKSIEPFCQCILPSLVNDGYHCPGVVGYNLDSQLNIINTEIDRLGAVFLNISWVVPFLYRETQYCLPWSNNSYLISNTAFGPFSTNVKNQNLVVFNYSPLDYKLKSFYTTGKGPVAFLSKSMDVANDSTIYTGNNQLTQSFNNKEILILVKLDKTLKPIWELNFSTENANYTVIGIKATSDLGFVIYGLKRNIGESDGVPFLIKFDQNGGISSTFNEFSYKYIKSYPNPSSGPLILVIKGFNGFAEVRIYDMQGRNVFVQHQVTEGETHLDLSALSTGNYIYRVYQGNTELGSGLWAKM
jgi:hypothetical protein